jgi:hypothetical protein
VASENDGSEAPASPSNQSSPFGILGVAAAANGVLLVISWVWPRTLPFSMYHFWRLHGSVNHAIAGAWPLFAVGAGLNIASITWLWIVNADYLRHLAGTVPVGLRIIGAVFSATFVPVMEEITFRWLLFYIAIVGLTGLNFLCFGFAGAGLPSWFFSDLAKPAADFITLHHAHDVLYNPVSWAVGAAALVANRRFQEGHAYQGALGWAWSWFGGIFLFATMFHYGLVMAIIIHALYNLTCHVTTMILTGIVRLTG